MDLLCAYAAINQRQALAARVGLGEKNPKAENAEGAESVRARRKPALVRPLHAMLGTLMAFAQHCIGASGQ